MTAAPLPVPGPGFDGFLEFLYADGAVAAPPYLRDKVAKREANETKPEAATDAAEIESPVAEAPGPQGAECHEGREAEPVQNLKPTDVGDAVATSAASGSPSTLSPPAPSPSRDLSSSASSRASFKKKKDYNDIIREKQSLKKKKSYNDLTKEKRALKQ